MTTGKNTSKRTPTKKTTTRKTGPASSSSRSNKQSELTDVLEKTFYVGIGAVSRGADWVKGYVAELQENGTIPAADAKALAKDMQTRINKESKELEKWVHAQTKAAIESLDLVTKKDMEKLKRDLVKELGGATKTSRTGTGARKATTSRTSTTRKTTTARKKSPTTRKTTRRTTTKK